MSDKETLNKSNEGNKRHILMSHRGVRHLAKATQSYIGFC